MKDKSLKIVGKGQKDQWIPHPSSNSPRVKSKQRILSKWYNKSIWWPTYRSLQWKSGSENRRKGRCLACNKFGHYATKCANRRDTSLDDDNIHSRNIFNDRRNDRYIGKGKRNAGHQGNGRLFKKARISRYEESNVVSDKLKEYYLILALSTTSPPDSLGIWLINSSALRHFIG